MSRGVDDVSEHTTQTLCAGDTVRMIHNYGREATVSSVDKDGTLMLCCYIGGRYQLRGPFMADDVEKVDA